MPSPSECSNVRIQDLPAAFLAFFVADFRARSAAEISWRSALHFPELTRLSNPPSMSGLLVLGSTNHTATFMSWASLRQGVRQVKPLRRRIATVIQQHINGCSAKVYIPHTGLSAPRRQNARLGKGLQLGIGISPLLFEVLGQAGK